MHWRSLDISKRSASRLSINDWMRSWSPAISSRSTALSLSALDRRPSSLAISASFAPDLRCSSWSIFVSCVMRSLSSLMDISSYPDAGLSGVFSHSSSLLNFFLRRMPFDIHGDYSVSGIAIQFVEQIP